MFKRLVFGFSLALAACGGASLDHGIDASRALSSLNDAELEKFCAASVGALGGEGREYTCEKDGKKAKITIHSVEKCKAGIKAVPACDITVGDTDACTRAQVADACAAHEAPACEAIDAKLARCTGGN